MVIDAVYFRGSGQVLVGISNCWNNKDDDGDEFENCSNLRSWDHTARRI